MKKVAARSLLVEGELRRLERERRAAADRQVVEELRKALRGLRTRLPQYDLPEIRGGRGGEGGREDGGRGAQAEEDVGVAPMAQPELFPAGPLAMVNFLFVATDEAGENLAGLYSLIATCEANEVNPVAYLADVLIRVQTHPASRIDELLPHLWASRRVGAGDSSHACEP